MKFALIYKKPFVLPDHIIIDSDTKDITGMAEGLDKDAFPQFVVDFDSATVTRVGLSPNGLVEIPDGEYGEATPAEYFENETGTMDS